MKKEQSSLEKEANSFLERNGGAPLSAKRQKKGDEPAPAAKRKAGRPKAVVKEVKKDTKKETAKPEPPKKEAKKDTKKEPAKEVKKDTKKEPAKEVKKDPKKDSKKETKTAVPVKKPGKRGRKAKVPSIHKTKTMQATTSEAQEILNRDPIGNRSKTNYQPFTGKYPQ
eukprot:c7438_g1_i1.p1 GENE.c7438_g1_i1~~c7438_g1_i1.p1  ORF type:complete len:178 (+),score=87.22 c7438_g1_i1:33-536(+)